MKKRKERREVAEKILIENLLSSQYVAICEFEPSFLQNVISAMIALSDQENTHLRSLLSKCKVHIRPKYGLSKEIFEALKSETK
jgi:3-methyladenine DNA glycosylase AlkC